MDRAPEMTAVQGMDVRTILNVLGKWRWLIIIVTGVSVVTAAFLAEFVLPKVYEATATLDVSYAAPSQGSTGNSASQTLQGEIQSVAALPQNTLETYQWQVTNPVVLQGTAKALKAEQIDLTPAALNAMIRSSNIANTNLISVAVDDVSPQVATSVANTLTGVYLQTVQQQNHQKLTQAVGFLQGQAGTVQTQLLSATKQLATATLNSSNSPTVTAELNGDDQQLVSLRDQLTQAQIQVQSDQAALHTLQKQLAATPAQIETQLSASASSTGRTGGNGPQGAGTATVPNPAYQSLEGQVAGGELTLAKDQATVQALGAAISTLTADISKLSQDTATSANLQALQSQVNELTQTYQTLMQNLTQAQVADSMSLGTAVVTVTAPAVTPTHPVKPEKKLDVMLALAFGLVVSVGMSLMLEQLDNTVKTPDDVVRLTQAPNLVVIPHYVDGR